MAGPGIRAGMEQAGDSRGHRIQSSDVGAFMPVAVETGQGKISTLRCALMLPGNNVVYLERKAIVGKGDAAIFAPVFSPDPDLLQPGVCSPAYSLPAALFGLEVDAGFRLDDGQQIADM